MRYTDRMNWKPATFSDTKPIDALPFELPLADQQAAALAREALRAHVARLNALASEIIDQQDNPKGEVQS